MVITAAEHIPDTLPSLPAVNWPPKRMLPGDEGIAADPGDSHSLTQQQIEQMAASDALDGIYKAIGQVAGYATHRKKDHEKRQPPHARISGAGSADAADDLYHRSYAAQHATGTMVMARSSGADLGAMVATRGFARAMDAQQTSHAPLKKALQHVQRTTDTIIPAVVDKARSLLRHDQSGGPATILAAQIVDNALLCSGSGTVYLYELDGGRCERIDLNGPGKRQAYRMLDAGRYVVVMRDEAGGAVDKPRGVDDAREVGERIKALLVSTASEKRDDNRATRIARELQAGYGDAAVMVGTVIVDPWQDNRSRLKRKLDYAMPSTLAFGGMAKALRARPHDKATAGPVGRTLYALGAQQPRQVTRRQLYETDSDAGRANRLAARTFNALAYAAVAGTAVLALAHPAHHHSGPDGTAAKPGAGPKAAITQPTTPPQTPPAAAPAIRPFPDYIARVRDPGHGNRPATATYLVEDAVTHYGVAEGLPTADTARLAHSPTTIRQLLPVFYNDKNPHNAAVHADRRHWLHAGTVYSTKALDQAAQAAVLADMHRLGITPRTAQTQNVPASSPVPDAQPTTGAPVIIGTPRPVIDTGSHFATRPIEAFSDRLVADLGGHTRAAQEAVVTASFVGLIGLLAFGRKRRYDRQAQKIRTQINGKGELPLPHDRARLQALRKVIQNRWRSFPPEYQKLLRRRLTVGYALSPEEKDEPQRSPAQDDTTVAVLDRPVTPAAQA